MLLKSNADVAYCYQRADENRCMAERQTDAERKKTYLDLENRWVKLALSYELSDRLNQYTASLACALDAAKKKRAAHTHDRRSPPHR